jgi:hypothetical protein
MNKRLSEENLKSQILQMENKFLDSIILRMLKSHPNKEMAKYYNDLVDHYDEILNLENDKLRFEKAIENLEKEYSHAVSKKNPEHENKLLTEIERYKKIILEIENKLIDKRTIAQSFENELKTLEDKTFLDTREILCKNKDSNIFQSHLKNTSDINFSKSDHKIYENIENSLNDLNDNIDSIMPNFKAEDREHLEIKNKYIPPSTSLYRQLHSNVSFK